MDNEKSLVKIKEPGIKAYGKYVRSCAQVKRVYYSDFSASISVKLNDDRFATKILFYWKRRKRFLTDALN